MRPTRDQHYIEIARLISTRSTCLRRSVGCVLVNSRGHVLATGYNGRAAGLAHCNEEVMQGVDYQPWGKPFLLDGVMQQPTRPTTRILSHPYACTGSKAVSGTQLDSCEAIHAEQNALLQCRDVYQIETCYVTTAPCITCVKLLMNTSCVRIVFTDDYPHAEASRQLWQSVPIDSTINELRVWQKA